MTRVQRWFLVTALCLLALGLAVFCLDYRVVGDDSVYGRIQATLSKAPESERETLKSQLETDPKIRAAIPLIDFGQTNRGAARLTDEQIHALGRLPTAEELLEEFLGPKPVYAGIYARGGLDPLTAALGGMFAPAGLIIAAVYLALGRTREETSKNGRSPERVSLVDDKGRNSAQSEYPDYRGLSVLASFLMAFTPAIVPLDLPALMLAAGYRYPVWVFVMNIVYAFGAHVPR